MRQRIVRAQKKVLYLLVSILQNPADFPFSAARFCWAFAVRHCCCNRFGCDGQGPSVKGVYGLDGITKAACSKLMVCLAAADGSGISAFCHHSRSDSEYRLLCFVCCPPVPLIDRNALYAKFVFASPSFNHVFGSGPEVRATLHLW